jgi:phosphoglycerol transferase
VLLALWVSTGALLTDPGDPPPTRRRLAAVAVAGLASSAGVYYAFFGCFFLVVGATAAVCRSGRLRAAWPALVLILVVCGGVVANTWPTHRYVRRYGPNPQVATRDAVEADIYGMNLTQLVLPRTGHRVGAIQRFKDEFTHAPFRPLPNDFGSSVGVVGLAGLAIGLGALFARRAAGRQWDVADLGVMVVAGVLLGTIAGLGSIFAYLVSPQIRAYDRISVFLGFLGVTGSAAVLDRVVAAAAGGWRWWAARVVCIAVLAVGLCDQTSPSDIPDYPLYAAEHYKLDRFVTEIDSSLPPGGMVLQLPFVDFPEAAPVCQTTDYSHFRLLLLSRTTGFSHGAVRGRGGALALANVSKLPPKRMVDVAVCMGFTGIHVDRFGYPDGGVELVARLGAAIGQKPFACENGRDVFFPLADYRTRLLAGLDPAEVTALENQARSPLGVTWDKPFDSEERSPGKRWRWCQGQASDIWVDNPRREPINATLDFTVVTNVPQPVPLTVSGLTDLSTTVTGHANCSAAVLIPPGRHRLHITCPAPALKTPTRNIYFGVVDFTVRVEGGHPLLTRAWGAEGLAY